MGEQSKAAPVSSQFRRIVRRGFRTVVVLVLLAAAGFVAWDWYTARELNARIEAMIAAGEPIDVIRSHQSTTMPNAAPLYAAAYELAEPVDYVKVADLLDQAHECYEQLGPLPPQALEQAHAVLAELKPSLDLVHQASTMPACVSQVADDGRLILSKRWPMATLSAAIALRTMLLGEENDANATADSLIDGLRMSRVYNEHPMLFTHYRRMEHLALCATQVGVVLCRHPSPNKLDALRQAFQEAEDSLSMKDVFRAEQMTHIKEMGEVVPQVQDRIFKFDLPDAFHLSWGSRPAWRTYLIEAIDMYDAAILLSQKDWPQILSTPPQKLALPIVCHVLLPHALTDHFLPLPASTAFRQTARCVALLRSARLAVIMAKDHGSPLWAASLEDVRSGGKVDLPRDPYTGRDFQYVRGCGWAIIFSNADSEPQPTTQSTQPVYEFNYSGGMWGVVIGRSYCAKTTTRPSLSVQRL